MAETVLRSSLMRLRVLLPGNVLFTLDDVMRIVAMTNSGSWGILPARLDCVAALVPAVFEYERLATGTEYVAVDKGVLIKKGRDVVVSVRRAIGGTSLGFLQEAVDREFSDMGKRDIGVRKAIARIESSFLRRYIEFEHE